MLQPTPKCLINVIETPFFVLTLSEVDIACFERMLVNRVFFSATSLFAYHQLHRLKWSQCPAGLPVLPCPHPIPII